MQKLIINTNTQFEIEDGGSIDSLAIHFKTINDSLTFIETLSSSAPLLVQFATSEGLITATYNNMILTDPNFKVAKNDSIYEIEFGFRPLTNEEVQYDTVQTAITYLTDEQAITVKDLYKDWERDIIGYSYSTENPEDLRRQYKGKLWKLQKNHNKQEDWYPGADPTLWVEIVEGHDGTIEDPIPVPDSVTTSGFEYEYGKYYLDDEDIYLAKREGKSDGEVEKLYFKPSALIGQYFEKVEQ